VVVRVPGEGSAAVEITVDGCPFVRYAADAVIVSTPTGSTNVPGLLVAAAAAHSSFNRTLVLDLDEHVVLKMLPSCGRLAVEVDGEVRGHVAAGDCLPVTATPASARVVRLGLTTFYERARRKLRVNGSAEVD
jgi:NAD+ kinase